MSRNNTPLEDELDRLAREADTARMVASWYRISPPYFDGPQRTARQAVAEQHEGMAVVFTAEIDALVSEVNR